MSRSVSLRSWSFCIAVLGCSAACPAATFFLRGDSNVDGKMDTSDAIYTLNFLFTGGRPIGCGDAADANDDGRVDMSDAIHTLSFLSPSTTTSKALDPACRK